MTRKNKQEPTIEKISYHMVIFTKTNHASLHWTSKLVKCSKKFPSQPSFLIIPLLFLSLKHQHSLNVELFQTNELVHQIYLFSVASMSSEDCLYFNKFENFLSSMGLWFDSIRCRMLLLRLQFDSQ